MEQMRFADVVGAYVRRCRDTHGLTLEDVARSGRLYGATWNLSSVRAIEAGKASASLTNLLTLALALGDLTGEPMRLSDFFDEGGPFDPPHFADGASIDREWLTEVLSGGRIKPPGRPSHRVQPDDFTPWSAASSRLLLEEDIIETMEARGAGPLSQSERESAFASMLESNQDPERHPEGNLWRVGPTVAVKRAASKLGITPLDLERHARRLWGSSFEIEVHRRAGIGSNAQIRGHVTRRLLAEIDEQLRKDAD